MPSKLLSVQFGKAKVLLYVIYVHLYFHKIHVMLIGSRFMIQMLI